MEPTHKTYKIPELESFLTDTFGFDRREAIKELRCAPPPLGCGKKIEFPFPSPLYAREYAISSLCASCQDSVFGKD